MAEALEARPVGSPEGQGSLEKDFSFSKRLRAAQKLGILLAVGVGTKIGRRFVTQEVKKALGQRLKVKQKTRPQAHSRRVPGLRCLGQLLQSGLSETVPSALAAGHDRKRWRPQARPTALHC